MKQLEPIPLRVRVASVIRKAILAGEYESGMELSLTGVAQQMGVSRGTFQRILYAARKSVAQALWDGASIRIQGGSYAVEERPCGQGHGCSRCPFHESSIHQEKEK